MRTLPALHTAWLAIIIIHPVSACACQAAWCRAQAEREEQRDALVEALRGKAQALLELQPQPPVAPPDGEARPPLCH